MACGYPCGTVLLRPHDERRRWLLRLGAGLSIAFVALRATNFYGDPHAWATQNTWLFTLFSFVNCEMRQALSRRNVSTMKWSNSRTIAQLSDAVLRQ